ncbi:MAG: septum formation initiator family protein [Kiritimatiellae bacterium]|nr:septum formation initiator family protein [Kiritimatiellia bacterium]
MSKLVDKVSKFVFFMLFTGIVAAGLVASYPRYMRMNDLAREKEKCLKLVEEKKAEIAQLRDQQRRFNTDREFIERLARRNHRVYPGELVFIFED